MSSELLSGINLLTNARSKINNTTSPPSSPPFPHSDVVSKTSSVCSLPQQHPRDRDSSPVSPHLKIVTSLSPPPAYNNSYHPPPSYNTTTNNNNNQQYVFTSSEDEDDCRSCSGDDDEVSQPTNQQPTSQPSRYAAAPQRESVHDIENQKKEVLYQLDRLEKKGVRLPRKYTMADSLEDMKMEFERVKINRDIDGSIRFQRRMLMACVTGIEFLNNKFDPVDVKLNGWSDSLNENLDDYDDIFEEMFLKYRGKAKMAPELRLLFMVGGSGVMFHLTNSMFKSSNLPDLADVMKRNPDLMRQFTQATFSTMQQQQAPVAPPMNRGGSTPGGGLFGMIGSMFGAPGGAPPPPPQERVSQHSNTPPTHTGAEHRSFMRGPKNVDEILREIQQDAFHKPPMPPASIGATVVAPPRQHKYSNVEIVSQASTTEEDIGLPEELLMVSDPAPVAAKEKVQRVRAKRNGKTLEI